MSLFRTQKPTEGMNGNAKTISMKPNEFAFNLQLKKNQVFFLLGLMALVACLADHFCWCTDLAIYKIASDLFSAGSNPYDFDLLRKTAKLGGLTPEIGPIHQSPPTLFLMSIFFRLTSEYWRSSFAALQVVCLSIIFFVCAKLLKVAAIRSIEALVLAITFLPFIEVLVFGQFGLLVLAAFLVALFSLENGRQMTAGVCFSMCLIKPHPIFLGLLGALLFTARSRLWRVWVCFFLSLIGVSIAAWCANPIAFRGFRAMPYSPFVWAPASLVAPFKFIYLFFTGDNSNFIVLLPAATAVICFLAYNMRSLGKFTLRIEQQTTWILISLMIMPYGFIFDHVSAILVPIIVQLRGQFKDAKLLVSYCILQGLLWIGIIHGWEDWRTFWFPPALLCFWLIANNRNSKVCPK